MHPRSAKRSTLVTKCAKNGFFCKRVKGVRFKKSTFWVQKGPHFGGPTPPKIDPGYGPAGNKQDKQILILLHTSLWRDDFALGLGRPLAVS